MKTDRNHLTTELVFAFQGKQCSKVNNGLYVLNGYQNKRMHIFHYPCSCIKEYEQVGILSSSFGISARFFILQSTIHLGKYSGKSAFLFNGKWLH